MKFFASLLFIIIATGSLFSSSLIGTVSDTIQTDHIDTISLNSENYFKVIQVNQEKYILRDDNTISQTAYHSIIGELCINEVVVRKDDKVLLFNYTTDSLIHSGNYSNVKLLPNGYCAFRKKGKYAIYQHKKGFISTFKYDDVFKLATNVIFLQKDNSISLLFENGISDIYEFDEVYCGHGIGYLAGRKGEDYTFLDAETQEVLLETKLDFPYGDGRISIEYNRYLVCNTDAYGFVYDLKNKEFVTPKTFANHWLDNTVFIRQKRNDLYGKLSMSGKVIVPTKYDHITMSNGVFWAKNKNGYMPYDSKGNKPFNSTFNKYKLINKELFYGWVDTGVGVYSISGDIIIPAIYDTLIYTPEYHLYKNDTWFLRKDGRAIDLKASSAELTNVQGHIALRKGNRTELFDVESGRSFEYIGVLQDATRSKWICTLIDSVNYQFLDSNHKCNFLERQV